jgi:hypothetical protein
MRDDDGAGSGAVPTTNSAPRLPTPAPPSSRQAEGTNLFELGGTN